MRGAFGHPGFSLLPQFRDCPVVDGWTSRNGSSYCSVHEGNIMSATVAQRVTNSPLRTPTDRLLTSALFVAPLIYLAADTTYAARGWDDGTAGIVHVLGAIAYGFVVLRVASWLAPDSKLAALILFTGVVGMAGNVAYGFEAIHMSFGDTQLVDRSGAANLIKPLGLYFPLSIAIIALALGKLGHRWPAGLVLLAAVLWPVAHIGNIAALAVPVNVALVVGFGSLARPTRPSRPAPGDSKTVRPAGSAQADDLPTRAFGM
jgi:hypothetical protein